MTEMSSSAEQSLPTNNDSDEETVTGEKHGQISGEGCDCRIAVFAVLSLLNTSVPVETYQVYGPDLPVLLFVNWEENNNSCLCQ